MDPHPPELDLKLLLSHRAWLRALAARLVGPGLADDLLQETWLAALRRPPDPESPARPWLAAVARRLAGRLRRSTLPQGDEPEGEAPSTDELLEQLELEGRLAREVARLADPFRRTVLLRYHEGLSAAEIARREGIPAGTVRWRLKRGLDELRNRLDRDYGGRKSWVALLAGLAGVEAGGGWLGLSTATKLAGAAGIAALLAAGGAAWIARPAAPAPAARDGRSAGQVAAVREQNDSPVVRGSATQLEERREAVQGAPVAAATQRGLGFEVIEWDGLPAADVPVAVRGRAGAQPNEPVVAQTDAAGRVAFPEAEGPVEVVIERRSADIFRLELAADGAQHKVELPRGAVVSGRVLVGGEAPGRPLELELHRSAVPDVELVEAESEPGRLFEHNSKPVLHTTTDPTGAFAFAGLADDWWGILRLPSGYVPRGTLGHAEANPGHTVFLAEPREGIEVDVDRTPRVRGRIVACDGAAPIAHANVGGSIVWLDGSGMGFSADADAEGCFEVLLRDEWRSVALEYTAPGRLGRVECSFARSEASADGDLGDLRVARGREVTLRVQDAGGKPIVGALIGPESARSDERGELRLTGLLEGGSVWVSAHGYVGQNVVVPADEEAIEVVLETANELIFEVRDRAGLPLGDVDVEVIGDPPFFLSLQGWHPDVNARGDSPGTYLTTWFLSNGTEGPLSVLFRTDEEGRLSVQGLRPGAELQVRARSMGPATLCEERLAAPAAGERRTVLLEVAQELQSLRVRVVAEDGAPLPGAEVELRLSSSAARFTGSRERSWASSVATDEAGRVEIGQLVLDAYRLKVGKKGYLPLELDPVRVPAGELELVLQRGLDVTVRVRDTQGLPVAGGMLRCKTLEKPARYEEVADGRFDLFGLPDQPLDLALTLAGATYTLRHDPRSGQADFVLPVHSAVSVSWAAPPGAEWSDWVRIVLYPEDGSRAPFDQLLSNTPAGEWLFPAVAPGVYEVVLDRDIEQEGVPPIELTRRARLEVRGGETARVTLVPLP